MNMTEQLDRLHLARMVSDYGMDWIVDFIAEERKRQIQELLRGLYPPSPGTITDVRRG
jgi:hypothetical protein